MPFYRISLAPDRLEYRNAIVTLETIRDGDDWLWRATKPGGASVVLLRRNGMPAYARDRYEGFEVDASTPADRILQRLVKLGHAEITAPGAVRVRSVREHR